MSKKQSLLLWSACLGNFFEHYDNALYGFLIPFLAPLLFPQHDLLTSLILTYALLPIGKLAKPLGALLFGYIGDRYGRKQALFFSLMGMSAISGAMACCPTFSELGLLAPLFFGLGKAAQSFFASGETMGGAIFILENTPEKKHNFLSSIYGASTIGGILLAGFGVSLLGRFDAVEWGWRYLYLVGCVTGVCGCFIRTMLPGTNTPLQSLSYGFKESLFSIWHYRQAFFTIMISAGFSYATYTMALVLLNGLIPLILPYSAAEMAELNTMLLILDFCALPIFGWLTSKISGEKIMLNAALAIVILAPGLVMIVPDVSWHGLVAVRVLFVLLGVAYCAPFHAWAQRLVPSNARYTVLTLADSIGSQLIGSPTAAISLWLFKTTEMVSSITLYWVALALLSVICLIKAARSSRSGLMIPSSSS